ncbi:MAG: ATP-binding protein [Candidatus Thiodiazotropha sp. 6PLUC3]
MSISRLIRNIAKPILKLDSKRWQWFSKPFQNRWVSGRAEDATTGTNSLLAGYIPVALVTVIGALISYGLFIQSINWEKQQVEVAFKEAAQDRILLIQREIKFSLGIVRDIASFIEASESVGRREFRKFVGPALTNHAGIKALVWAPRIDAKYYNQFLSFAQKSFPPFQIREYDAVGLLTADHPQREVYYPILYVQPYQENKQMLGLNIDTDTQVQSLFQRSISEKKTQIDTQKIYKPQKSGTGITIVVPVFFDSDSTQMSSETKPPRGFALGIFFLGDIVERALESLRPGSVDIHLYRGNKGSEGTHLYTHFSRIRNQEQSDVSAYENPGISYSQKIEVENMTWTILCEPASNRFEIENPISWVIFFGGLAFTALLTIYTANLVGRTKQISLKVAERTAQLRSLVEELNLEVMERKYAETELQTLNETLEYHIASRTAEAERRAEYLEQFAYVTSHDLKAPLRAVSNLAEWIEEDLEDKLDSSSREQLALLRDRVRRMHDLIEGLLEYSRVGKTSDNVAPIDTRELIMEITDSLSPEKGFTIKIKGDMPVLVADRLQLGQVFSNLISNSLKYHGGKKGKIHISSEKIGDFYEFTVRDNGQGIAPEYHDKIFKMFQTLESRDFGTSTGIGLALVKKIVVEHGGSIRVESAINEGASFTFTWPFKGTEIKPNIRRKSGDAISIKASSE